MGIEEDLKRLNFENQLWLIFSLLCLLNISGDNEEIDYLKTNNINSKNKSDQIFKFTLIVTLLIYIYFFNRNVKFYNKAHNNQKQLYKIKVFGSLFLIIGIILLIYFQNNQNNFPGSPAL